MENKIEFAPFLPGDRVVCTKSHEHGLVVAKRKYTVDSCVYRNCCGWAVRVRGVLNTCEGGEIAIPGELVRCSCGTSGLIMSNGLHEFDPDRFRPLQEAPLQLLTFSKIKEVEKTEILTMQ